VSDDGRGTETRTDASGKPVRKPVIATKDLRFFDFPGAETLPDGRPRRGMSVVAALSDWVVHTNRRPEGAWTQRYRHGLPVTGLIPVDADGTTGTTVHFQPAVALCGTAPPAADIRSLAIWPQLTVEIIDARGPCRRP
jgi:topoisomerase IV subunit B